MHSEKPRYRSFSSWVKETFGEPVRKVTLDTGLGCPNRDGTKGYGGCVYCNARGSGTGAGADGLSVEEQLDRGISFLSGRYKAKKFIAYFQSYTNTYASPEVLRRLFAPTLRRPDVVGVAVGTRPDCVSDEVLDLLAEFAETRTVWIEYGLQSAHEATLARINRGHGPEAFFDAVERTSRRGLLSVAHLILGLPGESVHEMVDTCRAVASSDVHGVKLHPLYVIEGTRLAHMSRNGEYRPLTEEEAIDTTLRALEVLRPDTVIHRMTSDPHPEELVTPLWMLDKRGVRARLDREMRLRDVRQGSRWGPRRHSLTWME